MSKPIARRQFAKFLAASPLFAGLSPRALLAGENGLMDALLAPIGTADEALDVFDFQRVAQRVLPPAHYGYLATGTDGDETLRANREAFGRVYTRAMRMVDTSTIDTSLTLLGQPLSSPIVIAPTGSQKAFHADGELATARAARSQDHLTILSNVTTTSIEEVIKARGAPVWAQLYPTDQWSVAESMIKRAEAAGSPVLVLTVDLNADSKRTTLARYKELDKRDCSACHDPSRPNSWLDRKPMYDGTGADADGVGFETPGMTWDYIAQLKSASSMKVVIKGIVTAEDAEAALKHGVDAIYVSNHGGRAEASGWAALDSLPEVVAAVAGEVPVLVDSGFRRGSDVFKALAMGADAVGIGRAYLWGLAAFGEPGVAKVLEILRAELSMVMAQMGTPSLKDIGPQHIGRHGR